jgi:hypothetical protein
MKLLPFFSMMLRSGFTLGLLLAAGSVRANVVIQTLEFRLFDAAPAVALSFNPSNPSLGFVTAVRAELEVTRRVDVGVWRTGGADPEISFTAVLSGGNLAFENQVVAFDSSVFSFTREMPVVSFASATSEINLFRSTFEQGQEPAAPSGFKSSSDTAVLKTLTLPLNFDGKVELAYDAPFWNAQSQSTLSTWKMDIVGKVRLTYEYSTIPEPAASSALIGGLVALSVFLRRQRARWINRVGPGSTSHLS